MIHQPRDPDRFQSRGSVQQAFVRKSRGRMGFWYVQISHNGVRTFGTFGSHQEALRAAIRWTGPRLVAVQ